MDNRNVNQLRQLEPVSRNSDMCWQRYEPPAFVQNEFTQVPWNYALISAGHLFRLLVDDVLAALTEIDALFIDSRC